MIWLLLLIFIPGGFGQVKGSGTENGYFIAFPCDDPNVGDIYQLDPPNKQNQYNTSILLPDFAVHVTLIFDSDVSLVLYEPDPKEVRVAFAKLHVPRKVFDFLVPGGSPLHMQISPRTGPPDGTVPCIEKLIVNPVDLCDNPKTGKFDKCINFVKGQNPERNSRQNNLDKTCGRRKVLHTELIVNGQPTNSGDWPWHVAISRATRLFTEYICGGTLLSKTVVLTAANCAVSRGSPVKTDSIIVHLGKHERTKTDKTVQERDVFEIVIHPKFNAGTSDNDIALLRLNSEAIFNDYVQPACLWPPDNEISTVDLFGTVVGWGFNSQDELSTFLQRITIPIVSELDCLKSNVVLFQQKRNNNKFCAGFANGTAACNGDIGGGFMIFVPDTPGDASQASGSWYIRGIISFAPVKDNTYICDPDQYTIFTDVEKYLDWLSGYLN